MSDALYLRTARGDVRVSTRWYDFTLLEGHGEVLVLPAPSPFLRGAHPLPDNRAAMPAFVAGLEAMGDGAAPGFRTLLECHSDEVAEWFGRLLTRAPLRRRLTPWLAAQGERLRAFEPELHCDSGPETGVLLLALTWEPMFSHVRTFHIHTGARLHARPPLRAHGGLAGRRRQRRVLRWAGGGAPD